MGLKSHDYHVIVQCLLGPGIRSFANKDIATIIIEMCNFFQQICARTLHKNDIEKARRT